MTRRRIFFAAGVAAIWGCSLLTDLDGFVGGGASTPSDATVEDGPADTTVAADARDSSDAGPGCVNLLLNPGFEDKDACQPWGGSGATRLGTPARHGSWACEACSPDASAFHEVSTRLLGPTFAGGDRVHLTLWLRAVNTAYVAETVTVSAQVINGTASTKQVQPTLEYQKVDVDYTFADAGAEQMLFIGILGSPGNAGRCMLVDDVSVCRTGEPDGG